VGAEPITLHFLGDSGGQTAYHVMFAWGWQLDRRYQELF